MGRERRKRPPSVSRFVVVRLRACGLQAAEWGAGTETGRVRTEEPGDLKTRQAGRLGGRER